MNRTRLAATIAALAFALPAYAQRTKSKKDASAKTGATAPAKSPAAAPSAPARLQPPPPQPLPAQPAAAEARPEDERAASERGFFASRGPSSISVGAGFWTAGEANGFAVQIDYGFLRTPPSWSTVQLEWHIAAMFARPTKQTDLTESVLSSYTYLPQTIATGVAKTDAYVIEIAPMARLRWPIRDKLALFVDAGAGIAQTIENVDSDEMYMGHTVKKENVTGLVVRGALGLSFDLSERSRVLLAPLAYSGEIGAKYSGLEPTIAIAYRL